MRYYLGEYWENNGIRWDDMGYWEILVAVSSLGRLWMYFYIGSIWDLDWRRFKKKHVFLVTCWKWISLPRNWESSHNLAVKKLSSKYRLHSDICMYLEPLCTETLRLVEFKFRLLGLHGPGLPHFLPDPIFGPVS
jgi:hypothetical protein